MNCAAPDNQRVESVRMVSRRGNIEITCPVEPAQSGACSRVLSPEAGETMEKTDRVETGVFQCAPLPQVGEHPEKTDFGKMDVN